MKLDQIFLIAFYAFALVALGFILIAPAPVPPAQAVTPPAKAVQAPHVCRCPKCAAWLSDRGAAQFERLWRAKWAGLGVSLPKPKKDVKKVKK